MQIQFSQALIQNAVYIILQVQLSSGWSSGYQYFLRASIFRLHAWHEHDTLPEGPYFGAARRVSLLRERLDARNVLRLYDVVSATPQQPAKF